jgi:hypothetical protein
MAITKIDRTVLRTLEPAVLAKLNETLGKDFGLHFDFKGGNFDREGQYAVLKLEIAVVSGGVVADKARADWNQYAELYDCDPKWIDQTFTTADRKTFKVTGLLTKKRKNCVSIVNVNNGEKRICSPTMIRQYLGGTKRVVTPIVTDFKPASQHDEIVKRINDMAQNNPEMYYADGEYKAAKMTERQIYQHHYDTIKKQLENPSGNLSPMKLFIAPR